MHPPATAGRPEADRRSPLSSSRPALADRSLRSHVVRRRVRLPDSRRVSSRTPSRSGAGRRSCSDECPRVYGGDGRDRRLADCGSRALRPGPGLSPRRLHPGRSRCGPGLQVCHSAFSAVEWLEGVSEPGAPAGTSLCRSPLGCSSAASCSACRCCSSPARPSQMESRWDDQPSGSPGHGRCRLPVVAVGRDSGGGGVADVGEPALQHLVHRRRGEDRLDRCGELGGVEQERVGLGAAESAVGADLVLEGGDLFQVGVVAAVDHQVGDRRVAVDLGDLLAGSGTEWCQRILADHVARRQIEAAAVAEDDRRAGRLADEDEPDLRMGRQPRDQPRVAGVDLLPGEATGLARDRDQTEASRSEHDGNVGWHRLGRSFLVAGVAQPRRRLGVPASASPSPDAAAPHSSATNAASVWPVRCSNVAPCVWPWSDKHDDLVRPRRPRRGALDASHVAVEVTQHGQGVDPFWPRVVGDLVVAEHVDVDRGAPLAHVVDHTLHRHVAGDHRRERAQQGVHPAPLDARLDTPAPLPARRQPLPADLDDRRDQRPHRLAGTREVPEVAGSGAALLALTGAAHRQHGPLGIAGEQVAVARAVVGEQAVAVGVGLLDHRRTLRMVRHHHLAGRLVDPAERRHVDGRAVQDAALADTGLRRPPGLPADQHMAAVADPPMQGGHISGTERPPEHGVGDAVELDEHDARHVGDDRVLRPPAGLAGDALVEPRVVVEGEQRADQRGQRSPGRRPPTTPSRTRRSRPRAAASSSRNTNSDVEDDRAQPERQHRQRDDEERQRRPDHRVGRHRRRTRPASASQNESIENPGRIAASSHSPSAVTTVTTIVRHSTVRHDGRSAAGRTTLEVGGGVTVALSWPGAGWWAVRCCHRGASPRHVASTQGLEDRARSALSRSCGSTSFTSSRTSGDSASYRRWDITRSAA